MIKKNNQSEGILVWITGLPGSGKSTIAKKIKPKFVKNFGPSILLNGDDLRKSFRLSGYSKEARLRIGKYYINFLKYIINQRINVIFAVVGLFDELRDLNKKNFKNYIEIYIKTNFKHVSKYGNKKFYTNKSLKKNIVGYNIKPQYPKNPDIIVKNMKKNDIKKLDQDVFKKILKKFKN